MSQALGSVDSPPPNEDDILRLVKRIQAKENQESSFAELHRRFFRTLHSFFLRKGFSPEEAKDLTQEVFFRVFKSIGTFRQESRFERWLFEIAVNVWKNELRRLGAEKRYGLEQSLDAVVEGEDAERKRMEPADPAPGALDMIQANQRRQLLQAALQELPPQMRHVCDLRYVGQRKYQEIADLLGISIETVKAHLHQARKRLMAKLGPG